MRGRAEVARLKKRLDATFERIQSVDDDTELRSDFARYLCVLVSGYVEQAIVHIVLEHARARGAPTLQRFVERRTKRFMNAKVGRIKELLDDFDPDWRSQLEEVLADEQRDAVNSIVNQRNIIAHGGSVELTYLRVKRYYEEAQCLVDQVAELCLPTGDAS